MRYVLVAMMIFTVAAVGCRKSQLSHRQRQQAAQTTAAEPEARSLSGLAPQPTEPQSVESPPDRTVHTPVAGGTYVVVKGDTFWSIAQRVYGDGKLWTRIEKANPDIDRNSLKPGQVIMIPPN